MIVCAPHLHSMQQDFFDLCWSLSGTGGCIFAVAVICCKFFRALCFTQCEPEALPSQEVHGRGWEKEWCRGLEL